MSLQGHQTKHDKRILRKQQRRQKQQSKPPILEVLRLREIQPKTENQQIFFEDYDDDQEFILLLGSAGTGKSFIAIYKALEEILQDTSKRKKLIIVRSAVQSRDQGFLPGNIKEKSSVYEDPYHQIFKQLFGRDVFNHLVGAGKLEFITTSFIRGMTFDDAVIVVDEIQNCGWTELLTITTRLGDNSRIVFCGDLRQNDLTRKDTDRSGLQKFIEIVRDMNAPLIEFTTDDIVRSKLVKRFLIATEKYEEMS